MLTREEIRKKLLLYDINFSNRELDCIEAICRGKTMKSIAAELQISPRTVETHLRNIKLKLNCNYKSEVIEFFISLRN